ncbi:MAG: ribosomal protein S18-alanine N-acetyltransferase [Tatlockia sp.]|nr:ribosomal protein S18-alanine N-acetyltransferase [Tatlockia sp.]
MKATQRAMQQSDIDSVYAIELASHRMPWTREILSDCVLVGYDCRVVEDEQNRILGYIICRNSQSLCHILNLCVLSSVQGKGIGTMLLQTILDDLKTKVNIHSVILEVRPSNLAALALYSKLGFLQDSIKKDYYSDSENLEDAIVLKKII